MCRRYYSIIYAVKNHPGNNFLGFLFAIMEKEKRFARNFYCSRQWVKCARAYRQSVGGLCERCWSKGLIVPGEEVHHKVKLTPENITDPSVALNWNNLELLCKNCHLEEHSRTRWRADELGHVEL